MDAGRGTDALVAEKVMGLRREEFQDGNVWFIDDANHGWPTAMQGIPAYSTEIVHAWEVVEYMAQQNWGLAHVMHWPFSSMGRGHNVQFYRGVYPPKYGEGKWEEGDKGQSFPLAICRAALAVLE